MSVRLLDVNLIISLLDSAHAQHDLAMTWFRKVGSRGWATCPVTENGLIRVVSHMSYPNLRLTPGLAAESLSRFKAAFPGIHQFWADDISLTDTSILDLSWLTGCRQPSDAYLAGLAYRNGGRLATLDGGMPWAAVRGADNGLIDRVAD